MQLKKKYSPMVMGILSVELASVLNQSVTNVPIHVGNVSVEDYSAGFGTGVNDDFKDISFD